MMQFKSFKFQREHIDMTAISKNGVARSPTGVCAPVMCRSTQQSTWSTSRQVDVDSRHGRQCTFPRHVYSRSSCEGVSAHASVTFVSLLMYNQKSLRKTEYSTGYLGMY